MKMIWLLILINTLLFGVFAHKDKKEFTNRDSSKFRGYLKGDEWFSWVQTTEGYTAKYNSASKNYEYMILSNEKKLIYSSVKVEDSNIRAVLPANIKVISSKELGKLWQSAWKNRDKQ